MQGLYAAYKDWTVLGGALPANITVEKPTGAWVSPTGYTETGWSDESNAYDDNAATCAVYYGWGNQTWSPWLTLSRAAVTSTQIKWYNNYIYKDYFWQSPTVQIDIYYGGDWHNIFNGHAAEGYVITTFAQQTITGVRLRKFNEQFMGPPRPQNLVCLEYEIYIWDTTGWANDNSHWVQGADERTLRCAIGDYDAAAGYVISYTHAAYLIALDDITTRDDIFSKSLSLSASDIDSLLELGRVQLTDLKTPVISIDTGLIDLSTEEGREFEELALGDTVTVIDEQLGIENTAYVMRINKPDLAQPQNINIEIASKTKDIIDYFKE